MECLLLVIGFLSTDFLSELFWFTIWLAKLIVKWFFWREPLILHAWCVSTGCCWVFLTQWWTPIYYMKYKPEMLSRCYRFQGNYVLDSQNVLPVAYWFYTWSYAFVFSECYGRVIPWNIISLEIITGNVISLSLRLSLAQENSGTVPLGELIGCTKLTWPKLNFPKLFLHQGFPVWSIEPLFSITQLSRASPWSHPFSCTSFSVLQQKRWLYLQNISIFWPLISPTDSILL